ncbi:MAG TPA: Wzz/FepE/Etk N-terminal domain-containing protein [Bryobacteraceae bacterium]|nr:Wzz/FepE/Etk N-terminal domain-containing protein [Bryobacteraceae bacterium]
MQPSQMSDSYSSVNRRPMDIEDYFDIVRRHKAWILGPAFAALVVSTVVACLWPDTYVSTAIIRVVPPQVPESFVPSNINSQMSQRINSMYQTISSRGNLTNIINLYDLYRRDRARRPMEDVVEQMRRDIKVGSVVPLSQGEKEISAFQIAFSYENRIVAQKVTADLVSRFMTENTRERTQQSVLTTQFLRDQLENAKKELDTIEEKLTSFRTSANGRLPDQVQQNAQQMNMLEQRIGNLNGQLGRISTDKMLLEADLRSLKIQRSSMTPTPENSIRKQKNDRLVQIDREIMQIEAVLANLRQHYKDTYPDVRRVQAQLNTAQKMREKIMSDEESADTEPVVAARRQDPLFEREGRQLDAAIERIEAQLKTKDNEAKAYANEITNTEKAIRLVQNRIESTPVSEQQYGDIIRDREVAKLKYDDLNKKRAQSQIAEDLERRQQGETLEVLDPASLPQSPTQPKRGMIIGAGTAIGVIIGLFLAGAREAKDTSLKNLKDVRAYTQLTILGSVPLLENDLVVRRRKRLSWLAWSTACLVGIVIMTGSAFYYYATKV